MNKNTIAILAILILSSCSLSPGMHMSTSKKISSDQEYVYIESLKINIPIKDIALEGSGNLAKESAYKIGNGDQISITIWGLPEIFPISNISPDQNLRRVDSKGNLYFPYAGIVKAAGKTQDELRANLTDILSNYFTEPQLDISIARFNSQKIYLLGEVTTPMKINITDIPLSLSDALGEAKGINTNTGDGNNVYIIRQSEIPGNNQIFRADLSSPAGFIAAGNFYLNNNDIIYVNAKGTARWNRVISQFFPFSTFLNSIDNLTND